MLVGAAERALSARGLCGERTDGWFAAKSTPGSLLRTLACVQGRLRRAGRVGHPPAGAISTL